jgi:hypothetical protein
MEVVLVPTAGRAMSAPATMNAPRMIASENERLEVMGCSGLEVRVVLGEYGPQLYAPRAAVFTGPYARIPRLSPNREDPQCVTNDSTNSLM